MVTRACALIAILLTAEALSAQQTLIGAQEIERAQRLLGSAQWLEKAWGAYLAGRLHSEDLNQLLIEEFRSASALRDAPFRSEEYAFLAVLFDAAIESGVTVPSPLLEPFAENWASPVLILAARDKNSDEMLMELRGQKTNEALWLAASNILCERKSQRWYAANLSEIDITHRFTVADANSGAGAGAGHGGGTCGDGVAAMPKGFPPVTLYALQDYPGHGDVLLAEGPENAYYSRTIVPTDKQVGTGSCQSALNRMAIRIGYFARLSYESADATRNLLQRETWITFAGSEDFARRAEQAMQSQEQGIRALLQIAAESGFAVPSMQLRIVPEVDDRRSDRHDALPVLATRDFALR